LSKNFIFFTAELKSAGGHFYDEYLLNPKRSVAELTYIRNIIQFQSSWHTTQSLLNLIKDTMQAEGNTVKL